jgi:hypothetical protein
VSAGEWKLMAERKTKVQIAPGGPFVDAVEVLVDESNEKWSEYKLSDGSQFRIRQVPVEVSRLVGQYDPDGNPMYVLRAQPIVMLIEVPERLKRKSKP